jgi:hypothetical protein
MIQLSSIGCTLEVRKSIKPKARIAAASQNCGSAWAIFDVMVE